MARTPFHLVKEWLLEALAQKGGRSGLHELVEYLETVKAGSLLPDDHLPQKGHPKDTQFKYYCRWAVTALRDEGKIRRGSPRGIVELESSRPVSDAAAGIEGKSEGPDRSSNASLEQIPHGFTGSSTVNGDDLKPDDRAENSSNRGHQPWLRKELAKLLPESQWDEVSAHEKTRLLDELEGRLIQSNPDRDETWRQNMAKAIFKRVQDIAAGRYLRAGAKSPVHLNVSANGEEDRKTRRHYKETCGQLLENYVREHFSEDGEYSKEEILTWFAQHYPLFKRITVQCHIEKYTTNYRSRVHYGAGPDHDLLFRVNDDWDRIRLYRRDEDPSPIYEIDRSEANKTKGKLKVVKLPAIDRHRLLLTHLSRFGELTPREQERLGVAPQDVSAWLDALLHLRPHALVVTPLFLWGLEGDPDPVRFTTRLAVRMTGEYLERAAKEPIEGIEAYIWERFGFWHLAQPHLGDSKWHGYLTVPVAEPADLAASEKLDLFAHLPPLIISELVRDTSFLNEQQTWSAQASMKGSLGPLSRQMNLGIRRPLLLSDFDLSLDADRSVTLGDLPESEVLTRAYVVAGLPLCTGDEWQQSLQLSGDELSERILAHPLYAAIVQFEVHRITAKLSGELAASVHRDHDNGFSLEIDGGNSMPLWLACRTLLEDLGFWPAAHSTKDATWESAVSHALGNLQTLGVLEDLGNKIHLTNQFSSKIKAHPGHCQNRGEKSYRVRLAQYLEKLSRGAS